MTSKRVKKGLSLFGTKAATEKVSNASSLFCWGDIPKGSTTFSELLKNKGDESAKNEEGYVSPTKLKIAQRSSPIIAVAASNNHAVCVSNEFKMFGSGDNTCGQLLPTRQDEKFVSFSPVKELTLARNSIKVVQVSCGNDFTAYLTNSGRVYTFGGNAFGQLGHSRDRRTNFVAPRMVQGVSHEVLVQVSCGDFSTYVLTKHGKVYACGLGKNGRLGVADVNLFIKNHYMELPKYISEMLQHSQLADKPSYLEQNKQEMTPVTGPLKGSPIVSIAAGAAHVLAVSNSGAVYGWGSNEFGQLGIDRSYAKLPDTDTDSDLGYEERDGVPLPVSLQIDNITAVAAGGNHSIFLSSNRKDLFVAGDNRAKQLGPLDIETVERIMQAEWQHLSDEKEPRIMKIACGNMHSALLLNSGNLLVLGDKGALRSKAALKNVEIEQVEESVQKVNAAAAFDIACGGDMTYVLTSPDFATLLEQGLRQHNLLKETHPIGLNEALTEATESKDLFVKLRKVLFDMQTLNASFLLPENNRKAVEETIRKESIPDDTLESSYVDIDGMIKATTLFAKAAYNDQEKLKIRQFAAHIVAQLEMSAPTVTEADQLRAYFILAISPLLVEISPAEHEVILVSIFKMPLKTRRMFFSWIYTDVACKDVKLLLDSLVKPMLKQLDSHVRRRKFTKQAVYLCKFLHCLHEICMKINDESELRADDIGFQSKAHIPSAEFYTQALDSFPDGALEEMYRKWHSVVTQGGPELNGQRHNAGVQGLFGRRVVPVSDQITVSRRERNNSEESLKSVEHKAAPIEGKTFGLKKFGLELVSIVDNTLEDTLSNISPDLVFFKHPFLLSATTKRRFMRIDDHNMHARMVLHSLAHAQMNPHLILEIRRDQLIHDTFAKLRELMTQSDMLLRRPLKIKFTGEEGLDAGGVKKEFFLLLSQDVFSPSYGNFRQIGNSGLIWFNDSVDPSLLPEKRQTVTYAEYLKAGQDTLSGDGARTLQDLQIIGTIMGLAVYNDTLLDAQFPAAMYQLLLGNFEPDKLDLRKYKFFDPAGAKQLEYLKTITSEEEMKDLDLTFEITQEAFGVAKEVELCEFGRSINVSLDNLDEYIKQYIRFKMYSPYIEQQAKALRSGFTKVISAEHAALKLFNTDELELLLCGTPELDFKVLRENSTYEGGYNPQHQTVKWFWEILDEMEYEQRKKFLKFSTGSSRAPIGGLKNVRFKLQRAGPDSPQLPTSHTCFNTFMLPDYSSKDKMRRLMLLAIENSEGFGLQ